MKKTINTITISLKQVFTKSHVWYQAQTPQKKIMTAVGIIIAVGVVGKFALSDAEVSTEATAVTRKVEVASVASLSNMEQDFPLIGMVTSLSEATIRSEGSGKLTRVYKKLGDRVAAGGVIAEFENSGERASVLQAEGAYEQAKAARDIAKLNNGQAGSSLGDTKAQALNTLSSSYTTIDDAIRGKTDQAYSDPKFDKVKLLLSISDATLASSLEIKRKSIEKMLTTREEKNKSLTTSSDLLVELTTIQAEAQMVKVYLDDLYTAYAKALPDATFSQTTLDAGKANTQLARQAVSGVLTALVTTRTALNASVTASQISGGTTSQSSGALATADAGVKQALGAYDAAVARLEKTIIRSPITGTLNSLSIDTGDYISAFTQVAVVSNNGALEIISFVTEDDAKRVTVGSVVSIDGSIPGVVTRIASAIDPTTKKIEVHIGIQGGYKNLINGQSVRITITKNKKETTSQKRAAGIIVPLSALKLTPRGTNVFTVSASGTLVALPVTEGAILGEQIQIVAGLTGEETIVVDARGLKEGMAVDLSTQ